MAEGSIKARIAALNLEEVHTPTPGIKPSYTYDVATAKKKPPPPPPSGRPPAYQRQQTVNNPPLLSNATTSARQLGNQPYGQDSPKISPALPPRPPPRNNTTSNGSTKPSPALPPRRPSDNRSLTRRESTESMSTVASGMSNLSLGSIKTGTSNGNGTVYQVRAPAFDPSKLPPLPPKKVEEKSATRTAMQSKRNFVPSQTLPPNLNKSPQLPARPSLPPRQPTAQDRSPERPALPARTSTNNASTTKPTRFVAPAPTKSILQMGFNNKPVEPPPVPQNRPTHNTGTATGVPPPIPLSSRPNLDAIMASKPKPGAVGSCLICRDYSGPDQHAARFPRQQLPSSDVGWLAHQLCDPFPSATDKARAIFVWLHHNIDYDTHSFFNGNMQPSTPERTITNGLAVCEGFAGLFAALALKAGLKALVCSGDSKGFGHRPMEPGDPMPAFDSNHAWNAVNIDNGEWKLIDACWGAGHVGCQLRNEGYIRAFNQAMFTMPNNDFGMAHYPSDNSQQFRTDGRILSFEEFKMDDMGGRVTAMADCKESGINERSIHPTTAKIKVYDSAAPAMVRFQFSTYCQHWDNAKHGKGAPYVMLLSIAGRDGRDSQYPPFNFDGHTWWLDIPRLDLGVPGQKIDIRAVTKFNDHSARGLTYQQWNNKKGYSAAFGMICGWELV